jgi:hypothetical protein
MIATSRQVAGWWLLEGLREREWAVDSLGWPHEVGVENHQFVGPRDQAAKISNPA